MVSIALGLDPLVHTISEGCDEGSFVGDPECDAHSNRPREPEPRRLPRRASRCLAGRHLYIGIISRGGEPKDVDDVIAGCVQPYGVQSVNVAPTAWFHEGLPVDAAATPMDRACGSSQHAFNLAASVTKSDAADLVVPAGVEHMGRVPFEAGPAIQEQWGSPYTEQMRGNFALVSQGDAAEVIADKYYTTRIEMDEIGEHTQRLRPSLPGRASSKPRSCRCRSKTAS